MGPPITLDLLTTRPAHSIINQSFNSRMRTEPLNGDGFGIAWYVPEISPEPAQFRSIRPAWNNVNLIHLARVSSSPVILAHVRAATKGSGVSETNCHPFGVGRHAFMHNGSIAQFQQVRRRLRDSLSDDAYLSIHGTTDSELLFALFRDQLSRQSAERPIEAMADALRATIRDVETLTADIGTAQNSLLNMAVSDGERSAVTRYATGKGRAPSLYYQTGSRYVCEHSLCRMVNDDETSRAVLVASEPLTDDKYWSEVPPNHMVLIDQEIKLRVEPVGMSPG
jgi:predicted glutamine amidotransferase